MKNNEILCRVIDMPLTVNAVTVIDKDGTANIYVNSALSVSSQKSAYMHECYHIKHNHFYTCKPVSECENEAKKGERK